MDVDVVKSYIFLAIGIICGVCVPFFIKKESRRISNGLLIVAFIYFTIVGGLELYDPNQELPSGELILGRGSEILFLLFVLLVLAIFISGIFLCLNGVKVVRKEGWSLAHGLPLFFGMAAVLWPVLLFFFVRGSLSHPIWQVVNRIIFILSLYVPIMLAAFGIYSVVYSLLPKPKHFDFIIVLGAGLSGGVRVTPLLKSRLNKALKVFDSHLFVPDIIVSGGQGEDEKISEAQAMKIYLLEQGVPEEKIILEDQSRNTRENLLFSEQIMSTLKPEHQSVLVTSNYHVLRAVILAKSLNLNTQGFGSKTARYYLPAAFIREYVAVVLRYRNVALLYVVIAAVLGLW